MTNPSEFRLRSCTPRVRRDIFPAAKHGFSRTKNRETDFGSRKEALSEGKNGWNSGSVQGAKVKYVGLMQDSHSSIWIHSTHHRDTKVQGDRMAASGLKPLTAARPSPSGAWGPTMTELGCPTNECEGEEYSGLPGDCCNSIILGIPAIGSWIKTLLSPSQGRTGT